MNKHIYRKQKERMPLAATQVTGRLESAVSFTLTRTVYAVIVHKTDTGILLLTCAFLYMHLRFLARLVRDAVLTNIVARCTVLVLGVAALHATDAIQLSGVRDDAPTGSTAAKLISLTSMLLFVSVLLSGATVQYNFVNVFLYIFADAIQSLMQADGAGALTLCVAFVTCSCASAGSRVLRGVLPGLEVLMQAATTANVNLVLDLVQDTCPAPLAHIGMLLLLMHVLEICKAVRSDLAETQGYAAYKVSALLFSYVISFGIDTHMLAMLVGCGLLVLRSLSLSPVLDQLLYLLCINASIHLTNLAIGSVHGPLAILSMLCLIISFETLKMLFG
jgi:hypothetical protein